jgi:hypothetical protein
MFATFELVCEEPAVFLLTAKCGEPMDFERFAQMYTSMYDKPRFALIVDLRELTLQDAPWMHLKAIVGLLRSLRSKTIEQVRGSAIITSSTFVLHTLKLLQKQYPMCAPNTITADPTEAATFVQNLT